MFVYMRFAVCNQCFNNLRLFCFRALPVTRNVNCEDFIPSYLFMAFAYELHLKNVRKDPELTKISEKS